MTGTEFYLRVLLKCLLGDYQELYAHAPKGEFPGEEYDPAHRTACRLARQAADELEAAPARVRP